MRDLLIAGRMTAPAPHCCSWRYPSTIYTSTHRVECTIRFQVLLVDYICSLHETPPCGITHKVLFNCWISCGCSTMQTKIKLCLKTPTFSSNLTSWLTFSGSTSWSPVTEKCLIMIGGQSIRASPTVKWLWQTVFGPVTEWGGMINAASFISRNTKATILLSIFINGRVIWKCLVLVECTRKI